MLDFWDQCYLSGISYTYFVLWLTMIVSHFIYYVKNVLQSDANSDN